MYGAKAWLGIVCGALLIAAVSARPAAALEWNLEGNSGREWELTFDALGSSNTEDIRVRGYQSSNSNGTGAFDRRQVEQWSGGVGVWASDDSGSPNHAVDNSGKDNFLLVEFDDPNYLLTAFKIGWEYHSITDVEIWVGGSNLGPDFNLESSGGLCSGSCDYSDLTALGFTKIVYQNVVIDSWINVNTDVTGRYVIFAGEHGEWDDYFKVAGIRGQEEIEVPEPGSMLLLSSALAVLGVGALRRRWRRLDGQAPS